MQYLQDVSTWNRLSNYEYINNYSQAFTLHGDLLAVTSAQLPNGALAEMLDGNCTSLNGSTPLDNACLDHQWICQSQYYTFNTTVDHWYHINNTNISTVPDFCSIDVTLNNATKWVLIDGSIQRYPIQYCLSEPAVDRRRVQFSFAIMLIVICCNFVKTLCMVLLL